GDEADGLLHAERGRILVARQRGVDLAVPHVGAIAAGEHLDLAAAVGMLAQLLEQPRSRAHKTAPAARLLLREQNDGAVDADREHLLERGQIGIAAVVHDEGAVAAEPGADLLAGFGMDADQPRQGQELECALKIEGMGIDAARDRGALGTFLAAGLAALHVGAKAPAAQGDGQTGVGILTEQLALAGRRLGRTLTRLRELAGVAALRIAPAAGEGAVLAADLEAEPAQPAVGALARIPPPGPGREDVRPQKLVQRLEHIANPQVLDFADGAGEVAPEIAQHVLPFELAVGDEIELLLEVGGEIELHIALEEALQEGGDEAAL